jgi:hypothetical protein
MVEQDLLVFKYIPFAKPKFVDPVLECSRTSPNIVFEITKEAVQKCVRPWNNIKLDIIATKLEEMTIMLCK